MKKSKIIIPIIASLLMVVGCGDDDAITNSAPIVADQEFTVPEDAVEGLPIGTVEASDADGDQLTFSIAELNTEGTFRIDSLSGEIILSETLNFNERSTYSLLTTVSDGLSDVEATITINVTPSDAVVNFPAFPGNSFFDGVLRDADFWSDEPKILSAGLGFCDIMGIEVDQITEELVESIGGSWASNDCTGALANTLTTTRDMLVGIYITRQPYRDEFKDGAIGLDALPMTLSWPAITSTIDLDDFKLTVSNGDVVVPSIVGVFPNFELNEQNTIVLYGEFGNKKPSSDPDARWVTHVEIIGEVILMGPNGQEFNAQGLSIANSSSPYDENSGPYLVGAKLNYCDPTVADGSSVDQLNQVPNHEYALYGDILTDAEANGKVSCRLRMLTTGGFSPDGINGVLPTDYEKFFRIHATGTDGSTVLLTEENVEYEVQGGTLKVIGLSDLGGKEGENGIFYDECYAEDGDNYIDVILVGEDAAMRNITHLEIPSLAGGYAAFYNPGGPGPTPYSGVNYTSPGPPDLEPVIMALDNPMRVSN